MPNWTSHPGELRQHDLSRTRGRAKRLRAEPTPYERRLWALTRSINRDGAHFRRQPAVGAWVFEFGDLRRKLLIEVDGGVHELLSDVALRDAETSTRAEANGFRLLRFTDAAVRDTPNQAIAAIRAAIPAPHPLPPPHEGEGE